jgi:hypothetical protein
MKPIEWADKQTIKLLWKFAQVETMKDGKVQPKEAYELMEKIVRETQASYDPLGNGSIARVDNEIVKGMLMFSSENRKTISRFIEALYIATHTKRGSATHKKAVGDLALDIKNSYSINHVLNEDTPHNARATAIYNNVYPDTKSVNRLFMKTSSAPPLPTDDPLPTER